MRIAKKVLALFLAVLFVLPGLGVGMTASAIESIGNIGSMVNYTFSSGTADITGRGEMYDYATNNPSPFAENRDLLSVSIGEGVTNVGA
nr:hypothetical protein [Clostridiales bacterium]